MKHGTFAVVAATAAEHRSRMTGGSAAMPASERCVGVRVRNDEEAPSSAEMSCRLPGAVASAEQGLGSDQLDVNAEVD